jgi:hypothetical protein
MILSWRLKLINYKRRSLGITGTLISEFMGEPEIFATF